MIPHTKLLLIGEIGMRRTEQASQVLIVLGMLVRVLDNETDGTARRFPLEHATEQFHLVGFLSGSSDTALSWTPAIQFLLDEFQVDVDACRHPVNHAAYSLTVTFSEGSQRE